MVSARVVVLLTAGVTAVIAFYAMFSGFAPCDDEGFLLISLREYARGGILYDEVFSQYGPAYHQLLAGVFRILGLEFTHLAGRGFTLVVWVSVAGLCGITSFRCTRRLSLALVTQLLVFGS
ncbi:MAG TPA: hypothetical protein VKU61_13330, partial [Candidatus Binatia bacterium]|nr:hypothetical protein [Candidatus Binatia bacterium]